MIEIPIAQAEKAIPDRTLFNFRRCSSVLVVSRPSDCLGGLWHHQHEVIRRVFEADSFCTDIHLLRAILCRLRDVSVAYAIWAGLGVLLIGAIGIVYFKEPVSALKIASTALVIGGVAGLYSSGVAH